MLKKKAQPHCAAALCYSVGTTRFELATTRPPDVYSTGLSYVPNCRTNGIRTCDLHDVNVAL